MSTCACFFVLCQCCSSHLFIASYPTASWKIKGLLGIGKQWESIQNQPYLVFWSPLYSSYCLDIWQNSPHLETFWIHQAPGMCHPNWFMLSAKLVALINHTPLYRRGKNPFIIWWLLRETYRAMLLFIPPSICICDLLLRFNASRNNNSIVGECLSVACWKVDQNINLVNECKRKGIEYC